MTDEGYIKFICHHEPASPPQHEKLDELMRLRDELVTLGLIGILPDGIGYGNISVRGETPGTFIISASATGGVFPIRAAHFSLVRRFDIDENRVWCRGMRPASSESLTHGAIYRAVSSATCVIHAHDPLLFKLMQRWGAPVTPPHAAFGTPLMAREVQRLARAHTAGGAALGGASLALVMGGHADGILFAASGIEEAGKLAFGYAQKRRDAL